MKRIEKGEPVGKGYQMNNKAGVPKKEVIPSPPKKGGEPIPKEKVRENMIRLSKIADSPRLLRELSAKLQSTDLNTAILIKALQGVRGFKGQGTKEMMEFLIHGLSKERE